VPDKRDWNWESDIRKKYPEVHEFVASCDGEKIAVPVKTDEGTFTACVNGELWEGRFEKLWYTRFGPDMRLTALVMNDDRWTVSVDDKEWEEKFEYVWNTRFSEDGSRIGVQVKKDFKYSVAVDGKPWENSYVSIREFELSRDGETVAVLAQLEALKEADIFGFLEGTWGVVVDDKPWDEKFLNTWGLLLSDHGKHAAAQVRLDQVVYGMVVDNKVWPETFGHVWEPAFRPGTDSLCTKTRVRARRYTASGREET